MFVSFVHYFAIKFEDCKNKKVTPLLIYTIYTYLPIFSYSSFLQSTKQQ